MANVPIIYNWFPYFFLREKLSSHDVGTRYRKSLLNSEIKKWNKVKVKDHYFSWLKVKLIWTFSSHENLHICTFEYRYQFGSAEIFDKKNLRNVFETTESDSAVSMTTRNQDQQLSHCIKISDIFVIYVIWPIDSRTKILNLYVLDQSFEDLSW